MEISTPTSGFPHVKMCHARHARYHFCYLPGFICRDSYFRLYLHYTYFNIGRIFYLQVDDVFGFFVLIPSIGAGKITLGLMNQILNAFSQVSSSFQYLVNSWTTIVELQSIYKRLRAFEATIGGKALAPIEHEVPVRETL